MEAPQFPTEVEHIQDVKDAQQYLKFYYPELYDIAECESSWRANVKNPTTPASGIFQFMDSTAKWVYNSIYNEELDMSNKNDVQLQVEMAIWLYERYHLSHWECKAVTTQTRRHEANKRPSQ